MGLPGLTPAEARDLLLSVGTHQRNRRLSPAEVAETFEKALAAGATIASCASFVSLTTTMVSRFLRLQKLTADIRHLVDWGHTRATLGFTSAWRLGDLNEDEQMAAARETMANQMSKEELRQVIQLRRRSLRRIEDCIAEVLHMRPAVAKLHVFMGSVSGERLRESLARLKQNERDDLVGAVVEEVFGDLPETSARLGTDQFTIVTNEEGSARLRANADLSFEAAINNALAKKVSKT